MVWLESMKPHFSFTIKAPKQYMHVLQVVLWYTSMTNEVHLNGMNKMEAFSHDEGYLHLCISEPIGLLLNTM